MYHVDGLFVEFDGAFGVHALEVVDALALLSVVRSVTLHAQTIFQSSEI